MPKGDKLTIKQRKFIKAYVETGNQTQSALQSYDTDDPVVASAIGQENLEKPQIQEALKIILQKRGLTLEDITSKVQQIANKEAKYWTGDTILRANEMILKLHNAFPGSKHTSLIVKTRIKDMSFQDAKRELEKLNSQIGEVVEDPTP